MPEGKVCLSNNAALSISTSFEQVIMCEVKTVISDVPTGSKIFVKVITSNWSLYLQKPPENNSVFRSSLLFKYF